MSQLPPPSPPPPPPAGPPPSQGWGSPSGSWLPPTAVGPAPGVRYAGHGERLVAFIIDSLIVGLAGFALFFLFAVLMAGSLAGSRSAGPFFLFFALFPLLALAGYAIQGAYFAVSWYRGGATPGMRMMGIRVVRSVDGGPLTKQQAILRTVGYWVSSAVMYLGFIWILIDDHRQGWHDKIADTLVIDAR